MATAAAANESRSDLLNWINDLLQLNISKIEQVGTGAVLCQIFDSIYGNVALHKVKFNTHNEYEYIQNFKVLQTVFTQNGIDKMIPVERLIKLKFQENLEFLQWVKKFWDANYPGGSYDAVGRRGGKALGNPEATRLRPAAQRHAPAVASMTIAAPPPVPRQQTFAPAQRTTAPRPVSQASSSAMAAADQGKTEKMAKEIAELRLAVEEVEGERDFYFAKLREIEVLAQRVSEDASQDPSAQSFAKSVMDIMYRTEEGYEMPVDASN